MEDAENMLESTSSTEKRSLENRVVNFVDKARANHRNTSTHFDTLRKIQFRYLHRGILPSLPLVSRYGADLSNLTSQGVAQAYSDEFQADGSNIDARMMDRMRQVASVGQHTLTLRAIFPEIEAIARDRAYAPGVTQNITSIPSLRNEASKLFLESPPKAFPVLWEHTDRFALTLLEAFDYAYAPEGENPHDKSPMDRLFRRVPSRHRVCHGYEDGFDDHSVINGLTILYIIARFGTVLEAIDRRVPQQPEDRRKTLQKGRELRRQVNNMTALFFGLGKHPLPN